jgi:nucleotide-binding universal stress UspA family protein
MKSPELAQTVLVPIDFTEVTLHALEYAETMARLFDKPISLLHVVSKGLFESESKVELEEEEALAKLRNIAQNFYEKTGIETQALVRRGSFYDVIGELAQELAAAVVVMGTHGVKGIQHIIGSRAIRVIFNSGDIPFLVVQQRPVPKGGYKKVVLPFSFTVESRQKLAWAIHLNKLFDCTFHILAETETDAFLAQKVENNLVFAKRYLDNHGCKYEISYAPAKTSFHKDIVNFAVKIEADLIVLMTHEESSWTEYFSGPDEQNVIANPAMIPVFCINPIDNMQILGAAMFQ